jgi:putative DNA primase/helicase
MSWASLPFPTTLKCAASAETLAKALGGRKVGGGWMAPCPAHDDRKPSLSICTAADGKLLVRCHAGCSQETVIATLRQRGLWTETGPNRSGGTAGAGVTNEKDRDDDAKRSGRALKGWQSTKPPYGTAVEKYLGSRGLDLPWLETIRFHPGLKHPSGDVWPAMVGLVTRGVDDVPLAIHRTFLARDGSGKAPVDPQKMMLGPCRGGAVRLAKAGDVLLVGEGIETCLAAMQASGHPAWAALSTSGLLTLDLPQSMRDVIVLADGDEAGEAAAHKAAVRWKREGRRVRIAHPTNGMDFNDMLMGRAPSIGEGCNG